MSTSPSREPETPRAGTHGPPVVRVLAADPALAGELRSEARAEAEAAAVALELRLEPGEQTVPPAPERPGFGLLVVEGLLMRDVLLGGRVGSEIVGVGDVLQPWEDEPSEGSVPVRSRWRVLVDTRLAVLDRGFVARIAPWPEISEALAQRMIRRSRALSSLLLISRLPRVEARILMLFAHLADRWGSVTPAGVCVPIRLTHEVIAMLVGCRRPTVTSGLKALADEGLVRRDGEGWLLAHDPLGELQRLGGDELEATVL